MNKSQRVLIIEFKNQDEVNKPCCCDRMKQEVEFVCPTCEDPLTCPDKTAYYSPVFDEYGLLIHAGSGTYELIQYCPRCGSKLP